MKSEILSDKEIRKFDLQIKLADIGLAGQEKIKKARILVIGAGGKGTSVLQDLVSAGVGCIGICDNFMVEESALPKQRLYGDTDLGKQKAIAAQQRLLGLTRMTSLELHNICLSESTIMPIVNNYDIIVDATDNFPAHYLINDASVASRKPLVFGSVFDSIIQVSVFNYSGGPSFRRHFPTVPPVSENSNNEKATSLNLLYGIAGNFMANEILKIILGHQSVLNGKLLNFTLSDYALSFTPII